MSKYLDKLGLQHLWESLKAKFVAKEEGKGLSTNDFTNDLKTKLDGIEEGANNYVHPTHTAKESGLYKVTVDDAGHVTAAEAVVKEDILELGIPGEQITYEDASTTVKGIVQLNSAVDSEDETTAATPAAVKAAYDLANSKQAPATTLVGYGITDAYTKEEIDGKISSVYKPGGSVEFASLPALEEAYLGMVYNVTDAFTTTDSFVEGAGKSHPAGINVVIVKEGDAYKYDVLAGFVDLSGYMKTEDYSVITNDEIDEILGA